MERGSLPVLARLTWLVGPPGAGKTTFAFTHDHGFERVVQLSDMLAPITDFSGISKGVLQANASLVEMIRALELREENFGAPPILVVAGIVPPETILPVRRDESVWILYPPEDRWRKQLYERPTDVKSRPQYADHKFSEAWYERFAGWLDEPGVVRIETAFDPERVGQLPPLRADSA